MTHNSHIISAKENKCGHIVNRAISLLLLFYYLKTFAQIQRYATVCTLKHVGIYIYIYVCLYMYVYSLVSIIQWRELDNITWMHLWQRRTQLMNELFVFALRQIHWG